MSEYKTEIENLDPGSRFYFSNDPFKVVWTVTDEKRLPTSGNAVFIYCQDNEGNVEDFNSNRMVNHLPGDSLPLFEEPKIINQSSAVFYPPPHEKKNSGSHNLIQSMSADIPHKESSIKIYNTSNYSSFRMINGNRQLNERKISKIIKEINAGNDMLCYYPIQVRENKDRLDILDGQHRFFIAKKLKRPVYYILIPEEKTLPEIAKINSNVEKWKTEDFINCYVQHGNENYKILQQFLDTYKISLSVALQLLNSGNPGKDHSSFSLTENFRNGAFEVKKYEEAEAHIKDCMLFDSFPYRLSRSFIIAIYRIKKAGLISLSDLLGAYTKRPEMLTEQANYKAYVNTLEQIVNVGKQKRIVII